MDSDVLTSLDQLRAWAFDLSGWPQRTMWAALAVVAGYLVGLILARLLTLSARKLSGLSHLKSGGKKSKDAAGAPKEVTTDSVAIDILGSLVKGMGVLVGIAGAAWVFGYPVEQLQSIAIRAVLALAILVAVWFLGSWLGERVRKFGDKVGRASHSGSRTLFSFLSSLIRIGALAIGLIAALQQFGFPIASLVAVVGAAGLAIALALQDTLKAVAAGVVIAIFRPYRIGDGVRIAGEDGVVSDITPFTTVLNTIDNREIVITNDKAWGDVIVNNSTRSVRRVDLLFSIDYDDDIDKAIRVIEETLRADPRVRDEPPVWCKVVDLATSSVDLRARAWCANGDWWDLRCDMLKNVKQAFDREGITIPYPHQTAVTKYPRKERKRPETADLPIIANPRDTD